MSSLNLDTYPLFQSSRPYTRWWWFRDEIRRDEITRQLTWVRDHHFGGVEIAWMYPHPDAAPGPDWLSPAWTDLVRFTKMEADRLGIGCDFTFSTSWPFGGTMVPEEDAARIFSGISPQRLEKSWDLNSPGEEYVLNHLDRHALERYAEKMGKALLPALEGTISGLFSDSWEVFPENLWSNGLDEVFSDRFGYDLSPYKQDIDADPAVRYDYRKLISEITLHEFFQPYAQICNRLGTISRVQCHGAPTDLVAAFATVDVPESEALLFEPYFSAIPASGAALGSRPVVTSETFTCIYGYHPWPAHSPYHKQERVEDLKLLADSVFANGVNHIIWHGMPYNTPGDNKAFYATTHVGPDSAFIDQLIPFNQYMETVSHYLKQGRTYSDVAIYLPLEDNWMLHLLPDEQQTPAGTYYWEMQDTVRPAHLLGYHPLWVSSAFLPDATVKNGRIRCGDVTFSMLYIDVEWLDHEVIPALIRLAEQGARICITKRPKVPGHRPPADYDSRLNQLLNLPTVSTDLSAVLDHPPLIDGTDIPAFWCRVVDEAYYIFLAHPDTKRITYPMPYEGFRTEKRLERAITIHINGLSIPWDLTFEPGQSIMLKVSPGGVVEEIALPDVGH